MKRFHHLRRIVYNTRYYFRENKRFEKLDIPVLTNEEKQEVKKAWPGVTIIPFDWICARIFKKIHGFSPYYLAPCWWNEIRGSVNPRDQLYSLENKSLEYPKTTNQVLSGQWDSCRGNVNIQSFPF